MHLEILLCHSALSERLCFCLWNQSGGIMGKRRLILLRLDFFRALDTRYFNANAFITGDMLELAVITEHLDRGIRMWLSVQSEITRFLQFWQNLPCLRNPIFRPRFKNVEHKILLDYICPVRTAAVIHKFRMQSRNWESVRGERQANSLNIIYWYIKIRSCKLKQKCKHTGNWKSYEISFLL